VLSPVPPQHAANRANRKFLIFWRGDLVETIRAGKIKS
jgi:hypothetical protein